MRILSWNVRGLLKKARRGQVREYIFNEKVDIVGLQETVKHDFADHELCELAGGANFTWFWLAAKGKSGGILLGVKVDSLEVENHEIWNLVLALLSGTDSPTFDGISSLFMALHSMITSQSS